MKKIIVLLIVMMVVCGCANQNESTVSEDAKTVGVLQLMTHDALDLSYQGFVDALKEGGYIEGENLVIDYQNPQSDQANLTTMAESIMAKDPDIVLAIATTPAQALQAINVDTPILATAVTDFVESGLVESNDGGELIAGVSDGCPMAEQLDLLLEFDPSIKRVGIIYTSSEPNSEIQANQMQEECAQRGIETLIKTVSDKTMIDDTLQSFAGEIDALYVPTDNNIASAMASVDIFASENGLPVLTGESNSCATGGLLSLGADYYLIGHQTGEMAVAILNGEKSIQDFGVETQDELTVFYNSRTAENIGATIPDSILQKGEDVAK